MQGGEGNGAVQGVSHVLSAAGPRMMDLRLPRAPTSASTVLRSSGEGRGENREISGDGGKGRPRKAERGHTRSKILDGHQRSQSQ